MEQMRVWMLACLVGFAAAAPPEAAPGPAPAAAPAPTPAPAPAPLSADYVGLLSSTSGGELIEMAEILERADVGFYADKGRAVAVELDLDTNEQSDEFIIRVKHD
jgi:hypothetical protein